MRSSVLCVLYVALCGVLALNVPRPTTRSASIYMRGGDAIANLLRLRASPSAAVPVLHRAYTAAIEACGRGARH